MYVLCHTSIQIFTNSEKNYSSLSRLSGVVKKNRITVVSFVISTDAYELLHICNRQILTIRLHFPIKTENSFSDVKAQLAERMKWRYFQRQTIENNTSVHRSH